jgi:uncharacterized membrane protein (UPF0127 family)
MRRFRFARSLVVEAAGPGLPAWEGVSFALRLVGLAGLAAAPAGRALLLPRCAAIHTWGMRCAIDVAFLEWPPGPGRRVLVLHEGLRPWRSAAVRGRARSRTAALEAPAGILRTRGFAPGAAWRVRECGARG